jgi:hypothetical protein
MKRLLRILFGLPLCPFPLTIGTWIWLWERDAKWSETVGQLTWWIASGQWDKLDD